MESPISFIISLKPSSQYIACVVLRPEVFFFFQWDLGDASKPIEKIMTSGRDIVCNIL